MVGLLSWPSLLSVGREDSAGTAENKGKVAWAAGLDACRRAQGVAAREEVLWRLS
jgi:hypothetical protein